LRQTRVMSCGTSSIGIPLQLEQVHEMFWT
jgi:hypothetical protein